MKKDRASAGSNLQDILARVEQAKQEWEATADVLPQIVCLLDERRRIIRANRTVERWGLARIVDVRGREVHELFHPGCTDPACYMDAFWRRAWEELARGQPAECKAQDKILDRWLHIQVQPVVAPPDRPPGAAAAYAAVIVQDITAQVQAEEALAWEAKVNATMAEVSGALISLASLQDISSLILAHARQLTGSEIGFVGYIDPQTGYLVSPTLTRDAWDICRVKDKTIVFEKWAGLWGWVLENRQSLLTNSPTDDPRSSGVPQAHIPIRRFLSAPALIGAELVGQVALANSDRDYTGQDLALVEQLASLYAIAIKRTRTEQALRQANLIIENSSTVLFRWKAAAGWPVELVSANVTQFGYTPAELLSGEIPYASIVYPQDRERVDREVQEYSASGIDRFQQEYRIVAKDGQVHWIDDQTVIERDAEGQITHYQGIVVDITERVQAEEKLRKLSQAVEQSANTVVITDLEGNIEYANPKFEETTGYTVAEALGQNPRILKSGEHPESYYRELWETITSGQEWHGEFHNRRKDGTLYWERATIAPVQDAAGHKTHFIAVKEDITARKQAEEALQRYVREQETLYAVASAAASSLTPDELLSTVLDAVLPLLASQAGWVELPGPTLDDPPRIVAHRGLPGEFVAAEESLPLRDCPVCAPLLEGGAPQTEPMLCATCPRLPHEILDRANLHSHVGTPLAADDQVLGILNVGWSAARPYTEAERTLLTAIGRQVGVALQNAQLYQTARQVDRLRVLNELDRALAATLDQQEMVEITLQRVAAAVDAPVGALFALSSPSEGQAGVYPERVFILNRGWVETVTPEAMRRSRAFVRRLRESREQTPLPGDALATLVGGEHPDLAGRWGPHGWITPIFSDEKLLAVLALGGRPAERPFTDEDRALMQAAAARAGQSIQNAQLYQATLEAEARYRELYHGVPVGLYRTTPEGRFLIVNRSLVQLLGYPDEETLLATNVTDLYVDAEARRRWQAMTERDEKAHGFELQFRRYDGSLLWGQSIARTVRDESGQVVYYEGSLIDITARKQAEKALKESQQSYATLVNSIEGIVWEADAQTVQFTFVSKQAERLLGYPTERWVAEPTFWQDHIYDQDREYAVSFCALATAENRDHEFEYRMVAADGRLVWLRDIVNVIVENGRAVKLRGVMVDITARKQAEETLREAEQRYRTVADFTYDWEYWQAPDGTLRYVSPACERITGYPAERFMANPRLMDELIVPEDREIWAAHRHDAENLTPQSIQFRIRGRDGETRWIEHLCRPVVDEQGVFLGYRASNRDITARKQAEDELRQSEASLAEAQRIAHLGNWDWNVATNELWWSDEIYRIFGLDPQAFEVTYDAFLETVHPGDRALVTRSVNQALHEGQPYSIDHRILLPDGAERVVHEQAEVVFDEAGKPVRMVGTVQDVTARIRLEERLAAIYRLGRELTLLHDEDVIIQRVLETAGGVIQFEFLDCGLVDEAARELVVQRRMVNGVVKPVELRLPLDGERGITLAVVRDGQMINLPDTRQDPRYLSIPDSPLCLSELCAPIKVGERVIGVLNAESVKLNHFTPADEQLLQILADQTAVALENGRLYRAVQKRAERLAALNTISAAAVSSLDMDVVLRQVLQLACQMLDAARGSILLKDPDTEELFFAMTLEEEMSSMLGQRLAPGHGIAGWVAQHGQPVCVNDVHQDPRYYDGIDRITGLEIHSLLCAPLRRYEKITGVIEIVNKRRAEFSAEDLDMLVAVAAIAASAIENARLYTSMRSYADRLTTLNQIGLALTSTLDFSTVVHAALSHIQRLFLADAVSLLQPDPQTGELQFIQALAGTTEIEIQGQLRPGESVAGWALEHGQPVLVEDAQTDPRWVAIADSPLGRQAHALMAVPLTTPERTIGVIEVISAEPGVYGHDELNTLQAIVSSLAVALENASLYEEQKRLLRERKDVQAQLIHSEKMSALGRLVASIAHEINNPLQAVQGCLTLTGEELDGLQRREKLDRYLNIAESEIERIADIVRHLRDFYRAPREGMQPTDLHGVLESVLELVHKQLQRSNVTLEQKWSTATLPLIQANPDHLKQVFLNLVLNAIDAMPEGGTLRVSTALEPGFLRVEFSDTGVGISPETRSRLFEPFFTTKEEGSGLGLSISYGIIESHGGQIEVESEEGAGTTFTILLPVE